MITIRNGQTIKIEWTILKYNSEVKEDLDKAKLLVFLVGGGNKRNMPYTLEDRVIHFTIPTDLPIGVYRLESLWLKGDVLTTSVDGVGCCMCDGTTKFRTASRSIKSDLFAVSDVDEEVSYPDSNVLEMKITTSAVSYGYDGLSAYELAVLHGEWNKDELAWLRLFFTNAEEFKEYLENYYYKKTEVDTKISKLSDHIEGEIESIDDALDTIHGEINNVENEIESVNQRINDLGSVYNVQGSLSNLNELLALNTAKKGDTYNIDSEFYLNGKYYAAGTNVVCITEFSSASENKSSNWDSLGGTFNASLYLEKEKAAIANKSDITSGIDRKEDITYTEKGKQYISGGALGSVLPFKLISKTTLDNGDIAWYRLAFNYPTGSQNGAQQLLLQWAVTSNQSEPSASAWTTINYINDINFKDISSIKTAVTNLTKNLQANYFNKEEVQDEIAKQLDEFGPTGGLGSIIDKGTLNEAQIRGLCESYETGIFSFIDGEKRLNCLLFKPYQPKGNYEFMCLTHTEDGDLNIAVRGGDGHGHGGWDYFADTTVTQNSTKPISSGAVYNAIYSVLNTEV
jgi:hypothetical protein